VVTFGRDVGREKFIFVDKLSIDEAKEFNLFPRLQVPRRERDCSFVQVGKVMKEVPILFRMDTKDISFIVSSS
jgi:hypothetical protein